MLPAGPMEFHVPRASLAGRIQLSDHGNGQRGNASHAQSQPPCHLPPGDQRPVFPHSGQSMSHLRTTLTAPLDLPGIGCATYRTYPGHPFHLSILLAS